MIWWVILCDVILCDRFYDSSLAYQGYGRGIDLEFIDHANKFSSLGIKPDITFYIDTPPLQRLANLKLRRGLDSLDSDLSLQERVYQGFKQIVLKEPERFRIIPFIKDGSERMQTSIRSLVMDYISINNLESRLKKI